MKGENGINKGKSSPNIANKSMRTICRGDIFYADLNPTHGAEQNGIRPVLVISNNMGNRYGPTVIVAPITSRDKSAQMPTHVELNLMGKKSYVLLEQLRTLDQQKRLKEYVTSLDAKTMANVDYALSVSIGLDA